VSRGQGQESQKHCWRGSLHSCECWLLVFVITVIIIIIIISGATQSNLWGTCIVSHLQRQHNSLQFNEEQGNLDIRLRPGCAIAPPAKSRNSIYFLNRSPINAKLTCFPTSVHESQWCICFSANVHRYHSNNRYNEILSINRQISQLFFYFNLRVILKYLVKICSLFNNR